MTVSDAGCVPPLVVEHMISSSPSDAELAMLTASNGSTFTVSVKVSSADRLPSLAVTLIDSVPASAAAGVPEKVRVAGVKVSQVGSAESSDCSAV